VKLEAEMEEIGKAIKALEAELVALGKKLVPLEGKEEAKTLDGDDRNRLAALRDKEKQLRKEKEQLREKEMKLMDERAEKRSKIAPGIVCFASVNTP
jgi:predicted  nucleic acid-binding Zn-ribbon protein